MIQEPLTNETLIDRVRAAADVLESVAGNRELLAAVPAEDRERLVRLAGEKSAGDRGAETSRASIPSPTGYRRWRGPRCRSDHRRFQHWKANVGTVPKGLQTVRLVDGVWAARLVDHSEEARLWP